MLIESSWRYNLLCLRQFVCFQHKYSTNWKEEWVKPYSSKPHVKTSAVFAIESYTNWKYTIWNQYCPIDVSNPFPLNCSHSMSVLGIVLFKLQKASQTPMNKQEHNHYLINHMQLSIYSCFCSAFPCSAFHIFHAF